MPGYGTGLSELPPQRQEGHAGASMAACITPAPIRVRAHRDDDGWRGLQQPRLRAIGDGGPPPQVVERFGTRSNSGVSWGPDGLLYATGHDHPELYVIRLQRASSVIELVETVPVPAEGQGIAWDRAEPRTLLTLIRSESTIVESR